MPALVTTGPSILTSFAFAAAFLWLCMALGRRLLRWLGVREHASLGEWLVLAAALGAGTLQFVPFALGAVNRLRVLSVRLTMAVIALALVSDLIWVAHRVWQARLRWQRASRWQLAGIAALLPALGVAALLAVTPTVDADGLGYHLTVPKLWLESQSLHYLPTYPYSNTPMGVEMLFTIALSFTGDAAAKTLHLCLGVLGAFTLYLAGKRLRSGVTGGAAAALYLVGPVGVATLLGCAYLEGAVTFAMAASALAWIIWFRQRDEEGWLRVAFALAGVGASFKITAVLLPIALGALTIAALVNPEQRRDEPLLRALRPALWASPLVLLPIAPWLVRSAIVTGNPVFPLLARWIPSRDLSPKLAKQFDDYNRYMLWGTRLGSSFGLEQRKLILAGVALLVLALAAVALWRMRSYTARAMIFVIAGTALLQLGAVGLYARYWIPSLALLELPLFAALPSIRVLSERAGRAVLIVATALLSLYQSRQGLRSVDQDVSGLVSTAFGVQSQREFLLRHQPLYPLYERANLLPADAKIILSTYCAGFYMDRVNFCAEAVQDSLRLTTWPEFMSDVRTLGATHVLAPTRLAQAVAAGQFATRQQMVAGQGSVSEIYRAQQNEFVGRLLEEHGQLLSSATDMSLYAVDLDRVAAH